MYNICYIYIYIYLYAFIYLITIDWVDFEFYPGVVQSITI